MMQSVHQPIRSPLPYREPIQIKREQDDTENTEQELRNRYADHTGNSEHIIHNFAFADSGYNAQQDPQER